MIEATSSRLARVRSFELTPAAFRSLALLSATALYVIVVTGATVRLTASGLGCEHWPGCQAGQPFPEKGYHSYIEFGNRLVGGIAIVLTLVTAVGARRSRGLPRWAVRLAGLVFLGTIAQAPLGYLTVRFHLNPYLVMSHFLLSAVVLGGAVILVLAALGADQALASRVVPRELQYLGYAAVAACLVLLVTGTIVTAAGPHPGDSSKVHRLWRLGSAIYVHAGATAAFAAWLVFALGYLAAQRRRLPRLFLAAVGLAALLGVQMAIGETQYHTHLPWWLVLIHVGIAAAVWTATVALATLLRRPISLFTPQPVD